MQEEPEGRNAPQGDETRPRIEAVPVGALQANCYVLTCPNTGACLLVDPGAELEAILERVRTVGGRVAAIVHTHGHFDHISATEAVLAALPQPVPVLAHPADAYLYDRQARMLGAMYGYALPDTLAMPDGELADGGEVAFGDVRLRVLHTPGHSPGSVSLICGDTFVLSGDTLFRRGIGRTDLPGGDEEAIYESIAGRLYTLPEAMVVYPGHGPATTIGEERRLNPFVQGEGAAR